MRVLIICDSFQPEGNAAAVHMTELQKYYDNNCIDTIIATSTTSIINVGNNNLITAIRFPNIWKRSRKYSLRAIGEILSAVGIGLKLRIFVDQQKIDKVIIYSPSIFWALSVKLAKLPQTKVNYVVRDIFPLWLLKAKILTNQSLIYQFLDYIAKLQFKTANHIFVQSEYDRQLLKNKYHIPEKKLHILQTWMDKINLNPNINMEQYIIKNKKNLLWLGNMGIAQDRDFTALVLRELLENNPEISINIVGVKPHDKRLLLEKLNEFKIVHTNINIIDQLSHQQCAQLSIRSDLGIFSLGQTTTNGNIPGKFITYIMTGLPVFGLCSGHASIYQTVRENKLGDCYSGDCPKSAAQKIKHVLYKTYDKNNIIEYFSNNHSTETAAKKLLE
jgi:glycosyltransferase involved in cell wall biosynthesis